MRSQDKKTAMIFVSVARRYNNRMKSMERLPSQPAKDFNPDWELRKIRQESDPEERRLKLRAFKEGLVFQREGLGETYAGLKEKVEANPDISSADLRAELDKYAAQYEFTEDQREVCLLVLEEYANKHRAVKSVRAKFSDDSDLFQHVFSRPPLGRVEIIEGPATLYFRLYDERDYATFHASDFSGSQEPSSTQIEAANKSGGVKINVAPRPDLQGTLIAENNTHGRRYGQLEAQTHQHERQHSLNEIIAWRIFGSPYDATPFAFHEYDQSPEALLEKARAGLKEYRRITADCQLKDELLAYFSDGTDLKQAKAYLMQPGEEGGLYDYADADLISQLFQKLAARFPAEYENALKALISGVLKVEYKKLVDAGIVALRDFEELGMPKEKIIGMLETEPVELWPKLLRRIREVKDWYGETNQRKTRGNVSPDVESKWWENIETFGATSRLARRYHRRRPKRDKY